MKYIIIPTYNEKENIENLVRAIFSLNVPDLKVLIVDDNSPDGTSDIVERLKAIYPVELMKRAGKLGLGSAYIQGFKYAISKGAKIVMEMDADFSHNPNDVPRLLKEVEDGFDMSIGSRKIKGGGVVGWNFKRKFMSDMAMMASRLILNLKTKDVTAGFRCYNTRVFEKIDLDKIKCNGYAFQEELLYFVEKNGFRVKEVPVIFIDRKLGKSKLGIKDVLGFFVTMFRLRFY